MRSPLASTARCILILLLLAASTVRGQEGSVGASQPDAPPPSTPARFTPSATSSADPGSLAAAIGLEAPWESSPTFGTAIVDPAVVPAGAIAPSTPIAPGQGPLVDDLGGPTEEQRRGPPDRFWYARNLSATWLPRDGVDGFGTTDVALATSMAPVWFDELPALLITPGFGFHFWQAPDALELPSTVYDASIDVAWRTPVTERLGFAAGITPGVYGDYRQWSPYAFQLTGWGLVDYDVTPAWTVVGGAAVVRQLGLRVLPVGGLIWTPNEEHRLELLVPRSRYVRKVRSFAAGGGAWVYSAVQFGGGSWAVTLPDDTTALVTVSDLRAILGVEWFRTRTVAGVAEAGWVFSRTISANHVPEFNPSDTLMLSAGATF